MIDMPQNTVEKVGKMLVVFLAVLTVMYAVEAVNSIKNFNSEYNTISIEGKGEVNASPDIAQITFDIQGESKTVAGAQKLVNDKMAPALEFLKAQGVEEKDIKTDSYSSYPKYEYQEMPCVAGAICKPGKQVLTGYQASQNVTVKVRKTDTVSAVIEGLGKIGVTDLNGPNFTIDDQDALTAQAREKAIADAKAKAEVLAKELGVHLGNIVSYSESPNAGSPMPYYMKADMAGATSSSAPVLPQGETKVTSNVTIEFKIK